MTNDSILVKKAIELEGKFLVPVNLVPAQKIQRNYTNKHKADLDVKTSVNKIGEIVNLSQELNSQFWHNSKYNMPLYYGICKLAVLSGLEIDSAKREVPVSSTYEINVLKKKYRTNKRPYFFKMITTENGYQLNKNIKYSYFNTSMDHLQKIINKFERRERPKDEYQPLYMVLKPFDLKLTGNNYDRRSEIVRTIRKYNRDIRDQYKTKNYVNANRLRAECADYIGSLNLSRGTIFLLIKLYDNPEYRDIREMLIEILFKTYTDVFMSFIQESKRSIPILKESYQGSLKIFDYKYELEEHSM